MLYCGSTHTEESFLELKLPILTPHRSVEKISWRSDCNVLCCIEGWIREGLDSKD